MIKKYFLLRYCHQPVPQVLTNLQRGKYFRVVIDGVSLEQELLDNKLAYEYSGGKKLSWCK